jgi:hypothetical protein
MPRLPATKIWPGSLVDDGDPVPSPHQSDVSHTGNAPYATDSQAQVRLVAPWQARQVMYVMPDRLCELHQLNGPAAFLVVGYACPLLLDEGKTHGLSVRHAFHLPHQQWHSSLTPCPCTSTLPWLGSAQAIERRGHISRIIGKGNFRLPCWLCLLSSRQLYVIRRLILTSSLCNRGKR